MTHGAKEDREIYGLLGRFATREALIEAAGKVTAAGYTAVDAYSPYPIEELSKALALKKSKVARYTLLGGLLGGGGAYFMQWYAAVVSYPLNVGGKPYHSWPAFIPITFEMTVLFAAATAFAAMFALNGLPRLYHPVFNDPVFTARASVDGFFLCVERGDPRYDDRATRALLEELGAEEVHAVKM